MSKKTALQTSVYYMERMLGLNLKQRGEQLEAIEPIKPSTKVDTYRERKQLVTDNKLYESWENLSY